MNIDDIIGFSILCILIALSSIQLLNSLIARLIWIPVRARIIDSGLRGTAKGSVYSPTFQYEIDGVEYESGIAIPSLSAQCELSCLVTIFVRPSNHKKIRFLTTHDTVICIAGLICCLILLFVALP